LQKLADETRLEISVCHFPPGTSKWNRIEHRLFSLITRNWRGKPLVSHEVIVNLIAATTTRTGLRVQSQPDTGKYLKRIKMSIAGVCRQPTAPRHFPRRMELHHYASRIMLQLFSYINLASVQSVRADQRSEKRPERCRNPHSIAFLHRLAFTFPSAHYLSVAAKRLCHHSPGNQNDGRYARPAQQIPGNVSKDVRLFEEMLRKAVG
jgi:hypothetical protein